MGALGCRLTQLHVGMVVCGEGEDGAVVVVVGDEREDAAKVQWVV